MQLKKLVDENTNALHDLKKVSMGTNLLMVFSEMHQSECFENTSLLGF